MNEGAGNRAFVHFSGATQGERSAGGKHLRVFDWDWAYCAYLKADERSLIVQA